MAREPRTLAEQLIARASLAARDDTGKRAGFAELRAGFRVAGRVAEFMALWAYYARREGRELNRADFIRLSGEKGRTVDRWIAEFRLLFPELGPHATPQLLIRDLPESARDVARAPAIDLARLTTA